MYIDLAWSFWVELDLAGTVCGALDALYAMNEGSGTIRHNESLTVSMLVDTIIETSVMTGIANDSRLFIYEFACDLIYGGATLADQPYETYYWGILTPGCVDGRPVDEFIIENFGEVALPANQVNVNGYIFGGNASAT